MHTGAVVSVRDLLAEEALDLRLLAGDADAAVRWVATSELEDPAPFLEGGEVLLTTGLRAGRGRRDWAAWTARLAAARVAAVGFGTGLSHAAVPGPLVAAAGEHGLALLEVPAPTPFIAVSSAVAELLRRADEAADEAALRAARELARDAGAGDGGARLLRRLGRAVGGSAWLLDGEGAVRTGEGPVPPEAATAAARLRPRGLLAASVDSSPERTLLVRPVGLRGAPGAHLVVRTGPHVPRAVHGTVDTAVALLGLVLDEDARRAAADERLVAVGAGLLLAGAADAAGAVLAAAGREVPVRALVLRTSAPRRPPALPADALAVPAPDGGLRVLVPGPLEPVVGALRRSGCRVGVGPAVAPAEPVALTAALADAAAALERTGPDRAVVRWDDPVPGGLAEALGSPALRAWAAGVLAPLSALDDAERERLSATLRTFLVHHGQRQPTAQALGVHRNTVRQRLARVSALLGRSLEDPTDRAELWLALANA